MKHATALHDPAVSTWEPGFQPTLHALVLVADDELGSIHAFVEAIKQSLKGLATVTTAERGVVLRNALGDGIEHNGYVDGISQPAYFEADWRPLPTAVPLDWDDRTPADNVLVVDPGTPVPPAGTPPLRQLFRVSEAGAEREGLQGERGGDCGGAGTRRGPRAGRGHAGRPL